MGFYEYEVHFWDEVDEEDALRTGVTYAENCAEATENIAGFYGDRNIEELIVRPLYPDPVYELSLDFSKSKT